ncbi:MAG TPA: MFS transporter [Xanthobacteraceae bacterium]
MIGSISSFGTLAGFGPYVAVYLADQKWTQEKIGFVLSAGALVSLLSQVPGGELLDVARSKRAILALGVLLVALSAMIVEFRPTYPPVLIGLTLQGITGGILAQRSLRSALDWSAIRPSLNGLGAISALPQRAVLSQRG